MRLHLNRQGFGHIAALFVVLFVAVVGFAGYKVFSMNKSTTGDTAAVAVSSKVPTAITNRADLLQTAKVLDDSSAQLDSSLNDNALNTDLNDML